MTENSEEVPTKLALMNLKIETIGSDVAEIKLAVIGDNNGHPGIVRQMDAIKAAMGYNHEQTIDARVKALEDDNARRTKKEDESVKDWKSMLLPSARDFIYGSIMVVGYVVVTHILPAAKP